MAETDPTFGVEYGQETPLPASNTSGEAIQGYRSNGGSPEQERIREFGYGADYSNAMVLPVSSKRGGRGYGWAEIHDHIARATVAAADFGYTQADIDEHLGFKDPAMFEQGARNNWAAQMAHDQTLLDGLSAPDPKLDLAAIPSMRRNYVDALLNGDVKGPRDFAYRYAAKAMEAAHDLHGLQATPETDRARQAAAVTAAEELIPRLPTRENLADATVGMSRGFMRVPQGLQPGNLHPYDSAILQSPDGSYVTSGPISISTKDGEVVIPTVANGVRLTDRGAKARYEETGENFGIYRTAKAAETAARIIQHNQEAKIERGFTRQRLMENWAVTGNDPLQAAITGSLDPPNLNTEPPRPDFGSRFLDNAADSFYRGMLLGSATLGNLERIAKGTIPKDPLAGTVYQRPPGPLTAMSPEAAQADLERIKEAHARYEGMPGFSNASEGAAALMGQLAGGMLSPESWILRFPGLNWAATKISGTATTTVVSRILEAGISQGLVGLVSDPLAQQGSIKTGLAPGYDPLRTAASFDIGLLTGGAFQGLGELRRAAIARNIAKQLDELPEPTVTVADLTKEPGTPVREVPVSEAMRPPAPAELAPVIEGEATAPPSSAARSSYERFQAGDSPDSFLIEKDGIPFVSVIGETKGSDFHIDMLSSVGSAAEDFGISGTPNKLGPREIRQIARQFFEDRPEINSISGLRVTGARGADGKIAGAEANADVTVTRQQVMGRQLDPNATPAEKVERVAQDLIEAEPPSTPRTLEDFPAFYRDLVARGEADKAALDLARAADTTASWGAWVRQVFGDVFRSESGAGPGFPPLTPKAVVDLEPGSRLAKIAGKNYADALIRQYANGLGVQRSEMVSQGFEKFFKDLSPFMPKWEKAVDAAVKNKGAVDDAMNTEIGRLLNAIEGKGALEQNSTLAAYARHRVEMNDWIKGLLDQEVAAGNLNPIQYRDFYIAHMVTPESLNKVGAPTSPGRTGNLGFTRQRTHDTYEDLLRDGYDLLHRNPIHMDLASIDTKLKAIATVQMQGIAKEQGWMRYYTDPREAARDGFKPLTGLNSEMHISTGTAGEPAVTQRLYGRDGIDAIWNNWVGWETMQRNAKIASVEDAMLKMKNASTYLKLMWPGFHIVTELKLGMGSGVANALTELGFGTRHANAGEFARGLKDLVTSPFKAAEYVWEAKNWRDIYRGMQADPALDAFVGAGGNIAGRSKVYAAGDSPTIWKLFSRGQLTEELHKDLVKIYTFPNMRDDPSGMALAKDFGNIATIPIKELATGITSATSPLWDHAIPLIKAGATIERVQTYIRQYPNASEDAVSAYARQAVENAEDRFGEQNAANLFWPVITKRVTNQVMLSASWTYGTVHAMLQGLGWNPGRGIEWNPVATTNLMGQLAAIAFTNAAWTFAATGRLPDDTLDYLIPFANARGVARIMIPGEEKEYYDWFKIVRETYSTYQDAGYGAGGLQLLQSLFHYGMGKLAPYLQTFKTAVTGENAIGLKPGYAPGGAEGWVLDELMPIAALQWEKNERIGLNPIANLSGVREAGKWFGKYDEWRKGQEGLHKKWTAEQLQKYNREHGIAPPLKERGGGGGRQKKESPGERRWRTGQ